MPSTASFTKISMCSPRLPACQSAASSSGKRTLSAFKIERTVDEVMTRAPRTVATTALASEALGLMNASKITTLFCIAPEAPGRPAGILHVHDCLRAGVV